MSHILVIIVIIVIICICIGQGILMEPFSHFQNSYFQNSHFKNSHFQNSSDKDISILDDVGFYVINLKSRPVKRQNIKNQFAKHDMSGWIFNAIDGQNLNLNTLKMDGIIDPTHNKQRNIRQLRRGEIGCSMSHTSIWNTILLSNKKYFLIFEDDAILAKDFKYKLADLLNEIKDTKWDVLYLNENCSKHFGKKECDGPSYTKNTIRPKNIGYGLYGYIITKDFIRKCNDVKPFIEPLDNYMITKASNNKDIVLLRSKNILVDIDRGFPSDTTLIK